jgi:hypothetical protein
VTRRAVIEEFEPILNPGPLEDLQERLDRWQGAAVGSDAWSRGVPGQWLAELVADWRSLIPRGFRPGCVVWITAWSLSAISAFTSFVRLDGAGNRCRCC